MNIIFDRTALEIMQLTGYRYFCSNEIPAPELDPKEGLCAYWELLPYKSKASAVKSYLALRSVNPNNGLWCNMKHLVELSDGLSGLVVYLRMPEEKEIILAGS